MRILITGVHGFVASHIVKMLADKHTIYGLASSSLPVDGVERIFLWDDLDSIPQVDVIIHLAAIAHDINGKKAKKNYFDVNVGLTTRIFDWFTASSASKFIFFSSIKAVASYSGTLILNEKFMMRPDGYYGESKWAAEQYISSCLSSQETYTVAEGKTVYILRPSMIYGEGNKGNLNLLYALVRKGFPYPLGAFTNNRTFTSVENVTFVVDKLIEHNLPGGVYNVCDDEHISSKQLVEIIAKALGKKPRIWRLNSHFVVSMARIGSSFKLPFNTQRLNKLTQSFCLDNSKIKKAIGIDAMPAATLDAMTRTIRSFEKK